jgi:hypothetical protein
VCSVLGARVCVVCWEHVCVVEPLHA